MSVRNGFVLLLALSALTFLVACGSSSPAAVAPPSGALNTASLSGTYIFSFSGTDVTAGTASFFAVAGALNASSGSLTGTIDVNDPSLEASLGVPIQPLTGQALTGGSYKITSDGRGSGTIRITVNGTNVEFGLDFVLMTNNHGLITRFDTNGTGSGTIDLQSSAVAQSALTSYAFSLSGVDEGLTNPFITAGNFALGGTSTISTGLQDFNDDLNSTNLTSLPLTGTVTLATAAGAAGTAQLTATGSPYGSLSFDVWPIDATHMKLIETDTIALLAGDAFTQQTTISTGPFVYTLAGLDTANSDSSLAAGGFFALSGTTVSNGYEDINDGGSIGNSLTVSGSLTAAGTGRYELTLGGFYNSTSGASTYTFAAYPTVNGGILLLETDNLGVTAGSAFPQTATTFASTQGYGLNLSGANSGGEVDDIAEFTANSGGTLSDGLVDENDQGSLEFDQQLGSGGVYNFDSGATGRGELSYPATHTTLIGALNLDFYVANSSTVLFIDADSEAQTGVGTFQLQSASDTSSAATHTQSHAAALKAAAVARARRRQK
jgi:hypothetical protein